MQLYRWVYWKLPELHNMHLCLWPLSPMTQHELLTDIDICLSSLFIRRPVWNVQACSVSSASGQMCVAPKQSQHEAMRNVTPSAVVCGYAYTYKGHGDYGGRAWRPRQASGLVVLIRSISPVCTGFSSRMTIPHPNPFSSIFRAHLSPPLICNWH